MTQIVGGVLAAGAREEELPLLAELLWGALPLMSRTVSGNILQGAREAPRARGSLHPALGLQRNTQLQRNQDSPK